jgi:putative membrane protein
MILTGEIVGVLVVTSLTSAVSFIIPVIALILRYFNFRVYRIGDTIYLQHGAIQQYKTSFKVNKINSVCIKRTFFARLMGKACLEVDVVGINATQDTTPILCILTSMENIERLMKEVIPDFIYENEGEKQPESAAIPWLFKAFWASCVTAIVYAYPLWFIHFGDVSVLDLNDTTLFFLRLVTVGTFVLLLMLYFLAAHVGFKKNRLDIGKDMFMFETGILDRTRIIMQFDRAQIVEVSAWPSARRLGLARCKVRMLSSRGHTCPLSGYYPVERLELISEESLERIMDGRYDYKKLFF